MAIQPTKGTVLNFVVAGGVLAAVAQVISIDVSEATTETYEARTLDQSGPSIVKKPTGYTDPGSISAEIFLDPALAGHQSITDVLLDPSIPASEDYLVDGSLVFADTATTTWTFSASGVGLGATVAMNDGLKGSLSLELAEVITYAT